MPVSSLIAGSRMLTADVLAFTTRVDRQVTARTPAVREPVAGALTLIRMLPPSATRCLERRPKPRPVPHPLRATRREAREPPARLSAQLGELALEHSALALVAAEPDGP